MKKSNLNATGLVAMKKLSKGEMKSILGGLELPVCFEALSDCNANIQCCSYNCVVFILGATLTGKKCIPQD